MIDPYEIRRRYVGAGSCLCIVDGAPRGWDSLRVRTMNFGQHWRTEGIVEVQYSLELPGGFFADFLTRELPDWIEDSKRFPQEPELELDLEAALRERGWPIAEQVVADPSLGRLALECFAHDLLLEWLGEGPSGASESYVLNTVDHVAIQGGVPRIEGTARRGGIPVRHQDE